MSEAYLKYILESLDLKIIPEYKFAPKRKFRFDFAIILDKHIIGVEHEGGIYSNGRHTRGTGYAKDCEKYNLATELGYPVLRYTEEQYKDPDKIKKQVINLIERLQNGNK